MSRWWPLTAVSLGTFMLLVDVNIVTVALPEMATGLDTSYAALQWVMDAYALALAAALLGAGALADRLGRRRVYVAGLVTFAASSLVCGLAPGTPLLIAARGVQGLGAAAMFATTVALISASYSGRDRGVAFGVWGAVSGAASGIGPIIGGLLTGSLGWRWIFLVNLPVSVVAVALTLRVLAESRDPGARRLDVPGVLTFAAAAGAATYGLIRAGDSGWGSAAALGALGAAAAALAAFVIVEARSPHPLLDLRLFRDRSFTGIMTASLALSGAAFAYLLYVSLWLQTVQGKSAIGAGLALLPIPVVAFAVSMAGGRFLHGVAPRWTVGAGLLLVGFGTLGQAVLNAGSGWATLVPGMVVIGTGVGLAMPNVTAAAMAAVPPERGGMAAGAVGAVRQLGYALGVAVLGAVFRTVLERSLEDRTPGGGTAAHELTSGRAAEVIARSPRWAQDVHAAFASGLNAACTVAGVLALAAGAAALLLIHGGRPAARPASSRPGSAPAPLASAREAE
ncbi:MFS transporter [Actinomadura roseirufa]|uniref:MFS transporter n=1 Tax=Actinomadura roseirufa TaxID=2094049 RepID=UPI001040E1FF|nr:MFS transporter [Actinomadura roseirufa]